MSRQTIGVVVVCSLALSQATLTGGGPRPPMESAAYDSALRFFKGLPPGTITDALRSVRPAPVTADVRARALATLPAKGHLNPTAREARNLSGLEPVLSFHERAGVVTVKVIDVPQAAVGLHARSILLLSRPAIGVLSALELQAVAAHEMGHDFFWGAYSRARAGSDWLALEEIELKCDGIAALTMRELGVDPEAVVTGARALARHNEALGKPVNTAGYPAPGSRVTFVRDVVALGQSR
jgi:hypothetical protein